MKHSFLSFSFLSALLLVMTACGSSGSSSANNSSGGCPAANTSCTLNSGPRAIPTSGTSTIELDIADASTTGTNTYTNEPLVSVTICTPNHTNTNQCQTISNVLLDTGSYGLRLFQSAIPSNVQLTQETISVGGTSLPMAECAEFGTGADWGPVQRADVVFGGQTATSIPIQVINSSYSTVPSGCAALCPDTDPCTAGYNGILGVGVFAQDCGTECANYNSDKTNPGLYFGCDSTGCYDAYSGSCGTDGVCMAQVGTGNQVVNPVASFASTFNTGVTLTLPTLGSYPTGTKGVSGTLKLGVNDNNMSNQSTLVLADATGMTDGNGANFATRFNGTLYGGSASTPANANSPMLTFIDSGSNGLFFPASGVLSTCADDQYFYCTSNSSLSATVGSYSASNISTPYSVTFGCANADTLYASGNSAFNNMCGSIAGEFDWGLPFFYGKTVYVGLSGTNGLVNNASTTGPYWAYH